MPAQPPNVVSVVPSCTGSETPQRHADIATIVPPVLKGNAKSVSVLIRSLCPKLTSEFLTDEVTNRAFSPVTRYDVRRT